MYNWVGLRNDITDVQEDKSSPGRVNYLARKQQDMKLLETFIFKSIYKKLWARSDHLRAS